VMRGMSEWRVGVCSGEPVACGAMASACRAVLCSALCYAELALGIRDGKPLCGKRCGRCGIFLCLKCSLQLAFSGSEMVERSDR
jgi:hypothetical protein